MADVVVAQRMWQRRDTTANWESVNPVLAAGEIGVEILAGSDVPTFKIGNGTDTWNDLGYPAGNIEMRVSGGWIQYSNDGATWENLIETADLEGPPGANGAAGANGREVEMSVNSTHIRWRLVGDPTWTNLIALSAITGPTGPNGLNGTNGTDGREVQMRSDGTFLQWRYAGDPGWTNLFDLSTLSGGGSTVAQITFGAGDRINPVAPGDKAEVPVMYGCTINGLILVIFTDDGLDGDLQLDVRKTSFASYPGSFVSICASAKPTITSDRKLQDNTLTGWTTSVAAGDILKTTVESRSSNVTHYALALLTEKA